MSAPALRRCLGTVAVTFLTLSVATPASSVFVIVPGMLQVAGTGALWALAIAGAVCVATALIYAELSSAWPDAGGEYVFVAETLGPLAGFVMLGVNVFNNLLFPPVAALGISTVAAAVVPGLPMVPVAVAILLAATLLAVLDIRTNAVVTGLFLAVETTTLLAVTLDALAGGTRPLGALLRHPVAATATGLAPASAASIGVATSIAIFALNGYGAAVYFAEEMAAAPRRIARAILLALAATLVLETAPVLAGLAGAPDLHRFLAGDDPFGRLVAARAGGGAASWVAAGVTVAIVNAIIAAILATARFFYASARDRSWGRPLDRWLATLGPRFGTPWIGTLLSGAAGIAACLAPLRLLLVLSGAGLIAIYAGIACAAIAGRRSGATAGAPYRMPWSPLAPIVTLAALGYVVWTNWLDTAEGRPALLLTAAQIAGAALYYRLVLHRRGDWRGAAR